MKKSTVLFLGLLLMLALLTATVQAEGGNFGNGLKWDLNDKGVLTISGNGPIPGFAGSYHLRSTGH